MKNQINSRDYELISAYLDNQLGSKDRARLEARMQAEPELRNEMHEISKTRLLLRSLPKLRAPRNYYINAATLGKRVPTRPSLRLAPAMGIVSAVASILLVMVVFGDRLLTPIAPTAPVAMAPAIVATTEISPNVQSERNVEPTEGFTEAPPMVAMSAPAFEAPTATSPTLKMTVTENATPTTVYVYAYPATSTPLVGLGMGMGQGLQQDTAVPCDKYSGSGEHPLPSPYDNCPTATETAPGLLHGFAQPLTATPTDTPTFSPTLTATPTDTPSPSPSPSPTPTETPAPVMAIAPTLAAKTVGGESTSGPASDTGISTTPEAESVPAASTAPNTGFIRYIILAAELSLAVIAILAGLSAIILRITSGR